MTDCIVFDIDGTLSDPSHRLHHVTNGKRDWPAFFAGMSEDAPKHDVIWLNWLASRADGVAILIVTARPGDYFEQTEDWLRRHGVEYDNIYMRKIGDTRQDAIVKSEIIDQIEAEGYCIRAWVDDRQQVVEAVRQRGITVLQCASWDDRIDQVRRPTLTVMVGPSGAGKSTWISERNDVQPGQVVSTDNLRLQLTGSQEDQSQNDAVFAAAHAITRTRLRHGLDVIFDATNLRRKDRLAVVECAEGTGAVIKYVVIDRPLSAKITTRGWRPEWLVEKHHQRMQSVVRDALRGDDIDGVEVVDLREVG